MIKRRVNCKRCGFKGYVKAHDTIKHPKELLFEVIRKDEEGYIYLLCPSCYEANEKYSPYVFMSPIPKLGCLIVVMIIVYYIFKIITR